MGALHDIRLIGQSVKDVVFALPGQVYRSWQMPPIRNAVKHALSGDDMSNYVPYYFGNPQLFKMPAQYREPGPPLTPPSLAAFEEDSLSKALPYIAIGIAGIVAYNMFFRKKGKRRA